MNRLTLLACMVLAAMPPAQADEQLPYLIPPSKFEPPSAKVKAAILTALCDGKVDNGACDTCPGGSGPGGGGFTLNQVIQGHFKQPGSVDAMVTLSGCEQMHATIAWGYLLTRVDGEWQAGGEMLGLDLDHCRKMKFQSGRELLVCEDYRMESFELMHTVEAIFDGGDALHVRALLTTTDTTRLCGQQTLVRKGQIDKVEFRDLNGDGMEDVTFMASLGTMADSKRRQEVCEAAQPYKSRVRRLEPKATKSYKIEYLFDGRQFKLTPDSRAAAKVFQPEE